MAKTLNSTTNEADEANYNNDVGNDSFLHTVLFVTLVTYASLSLLFVLKTKCKIFLSGNRSWNYGNYSTPTHTHRSPYYPNPKPHTRLCHRLRRWFHRMTSWQDHSLIFPIPDQLQLDESSHQSWSVLEVAHWIHSKLILSTRQKPINQQRISQYANNNDNVHVLFPLDSTPTTTSSICGFSTNNYVGRCQQLLGNPGDDELLDDEYRSYMAIHSAIQILMKQRIDGASLQHLSLDRLNNFGIPFGIALQIMFHLENLIPEFSRQDLEMAKVTAEGGLPSWYENAELNESRLGKNGDNSIGNPNANDFSNEDQNDITERAQQLMKDRYGITLPSLRNENKHNQYQEVDNDADDDQLDNENVVLNMGSETRQFSSLSPNSLEIDRGIHDESDGRHHSRRESNRGQVNSIRNIFNSMPPHIRAAAARRPDLVEKLMSEKQQRHQQQQQQQQQQQLNRIGIEVAPCPTPLPSISEPENDTSDALGYGQSNTSWLESTELSIPSGHKQFMGHTRFRGLEIVRSEDDECKSNSESVSLLRRISGSKEQ